MLGFFLRCRGFRVKYFFVFEGVFFRKFFFCVLVNVFLGLGRYADRGLIGR